MQMNNRKDDVGGLATLMTIARDGVEQSVVHH